MLDSKTVKVHTTSGNCFRLCGTFRTTMLIIFNMLAWVSCFFAMFHFAVIYQTAIESRIKFIVFLSLIKLSSWYISLVINAVGRKYPLLALTFVAMLLHVFLTFMQPQFATWIQSWFNVHRYNLSFLLRTFSTIYDKIVGKDIFSRINFWFETQSQLISSRWFKIMIFVNL